MFLKLLVSKNLWRRGRERLSRFPSKICWLTLANNCRGTLSSLRKIVVSKFKKNGRGLLLRFPVETFLCYSTKTFCRESYHVSKTFSKSLKEKMLGVAYLDFPSRTFCLTEPVQRRILLLSVYLSCRKKITIQEVAGITIFRRNCFVSQYRNILLRIPQRFRKFAVSKSSVYELGGSTIFCRLLFVSHILETFHRGSL